MLEIKSLFAAITLGKRRGCSSLILFLVILIITITTSFGFTHLMPRKDGAFVNLWHIATMSIACIGMTVAGIVLLPSKSANDDKATLVKIEKAQRLLKTWYDLIWIVVAFLSLGLIASRFATQYFSETEARWREISNLQSEDVASTAKNAVMKISLLPHNDRGSNDASVSNELSAYSERDVFRILQEPSYVRGTQRSIFLSTTAIEGIEQVRKASKQFEVTAQQIDAYRELQDEFTPGFVTKLFMPFLLALALGLRLAKAFSDMKDASND